MKLPKFRTNSFERTAEHQEVLELLKARLTNVPLLGYPDIRRPFDWIWMHHCKGWVQCFHKEPNMTEVG